MKVRMYLSMFALLVSAVACRGEADRPAAPAAVAGDAAPGESFRNVVEGVLPSIVFIQTEATPPPGIERLLPGVQRAPQEPIPFGMGSGVLMTEDGYILTNNHVVQDAERVLVMLHDRRYFEAEVIGRDPATEVAVIRIQGTGLPAARLGDSDRVALGDWVLAMGSPLGLQFSVTAGIVSGTGRDIGILAAEMDPAAEGAAPLEHFIQTDAALSPGNSGGPLVNAAGEVIGINTAVAADRRGPAGYGFAIPSNLARRLADQLIQFGEVRRSYLGVALRNVTPRAAQQQGLQTAEGAQVMQLEPGSPAAQAGLQHEDIIVAVGDRAVQSVSDLQAALVQLDPGSQVTMRVLRQGRPVDVSVQLGMVRSGIGPRVVPAG
jgi:serine protease Do